VTSALSALARACRAEAAGTRGLPSRAATSGTRASIAAASGRAVALVRITANRILCFGARLRTGAARDVGGLALGAPRTACDRAMIEADQVAQLVELLLPELARVADAQPVERQVAERDALKLVDAVTERLEHTVDLALLALVDRD